MFNELQLSCLQEYVNHFMQNLRYSCPIMTKIKMYGLILVKRPQFHFLENLFGCSRLITWGTGTDRL
jgi:hypothetical protein